MSGENIIKNNVRKMHPQVTLLFFVNLKIKNRNYENTILTYKSSNNFSLSFFYVTFWIVLAP